MDRSLYFIDFLPLFFLLKFTYYTDTKTYYHDNFFTRFYYRVEELLLGPTCCPYHLYSLRFPFNSFN